MDMLISTLRPNTFGPIPGHLLDTGPQQGTPVELKAKQELFRGGITKMLVGTLRALAALVVVGAGDTELGNCRKLTLFSGDGVQAASHPKKNGKRTEYARR